VTSREERLAGNENLFRNVNERIVELGDQWDGTYDLVCECVDTNCMGVMRVDTEDYERLRLTTGRFAVLSGHERPEIEDVVERHQTYLVVEKHVGPRSLEQTPLTSSTAPQPPRYQPRAAKRRSS
jgi:hypothetical protein